MTDKIFFAPTADAAVTYTVTRRDGDKLGAVIGHHPDAGVFLLGTKPGGAFETSGVPQGVLVEVDGMAVSAGSHHDAMRRLADLQAAGTQSFTVALRPVVSDTRPVPAEDTSSAAAPAPHGSDDIRGAVRKLYPQLDDRDVDAVAHGFQTQYQERPAVLQRELSTTAEGADEVLMDLVDETIAVRVNSDACDPAARRASSEIASTTAGEESGSSVDGRGSESGVTVETGPTERDTACRATPSVTTASCPTTPRGGGARADARNPAVVDALAGEDSPICRALQVEVHAALAAQRQEFAGAIERVELLVAQLARDAPQRTGAQHAQEYSASDGRIDDASTREDLAHGRAGIAQGGHGGEPDAVMTTAQDGVGAAEEAEADSNAAGDNGNVSDKTEKPAVDGFECNTSEVQRAWHEKIADALRALHPEMTDAEHAAALAGCVSESSDATALEAVWCGLQDELVARLEEATASAAAFDEALAALVRELHPHLGGGEEVARTVAAYRAEHSGPVERLYEALEREVMGRRHVEAWGGPLRDVLTDLHAGMSDDALDDLVREYMVSHEGRLHTLVGGLRELVGTPGRTLAAFDEEEQRERAGIAAAYYRSTAGIKHAMREAHAFCGIMATLVSRERERRDHVEREEAALRVGRLGFLRDALVKVVGAGEPQRRTAAPTRVTPSAAGLEGGQMIFDTRSVGRSPTRLPEAKFSMASTTGPLHELSRAEMVHVAQYAVREARSAASRSASASGVPLDVRLPPASAPRSSGRFSQRQCSKALSVSNSTTTAVTPPGYAVPPPALPHHTPTRSPSQSRRLASSRVPTTVASAPVFVSPLRRRAPAVSTTPPVGFERKPQQQINVDYPRARAGPRAGIARGAFSEPAAMLHRSTSRSASPHSRFDSTVVLGRGWEAYRHDTLGERMPRQERERVL